MRSSARDHLHRLRQIADLGSRKIRRFDRCDEHNVVVLAYDGKNLYERIHINVLTCEVTTTRMKRKEAKHLGLTGSVCPSIRDTETTRVYRDNDRFVVSKRDGDRFSGGYVSCYTGTKHLWTYKPTESEICSYYRGRVFPGVGCRVKANAEQLIFHPSAQWVAFSFLDHLYFLNQEGQLVRHMTTTELLSELDASPEYYSWQKYPRPLVKGLWVAPDGSCIIVSIYRWIIWMTDRGEIVHHLRLEEEFEDDEGRCRYMRGLAFIEKDGSSLLLDDYQVFVRISNGSITHEFKRPLRSAWWDYHSGHDLLIIISGASLGISTSTGKTLGTVAIEPSAGLPAISADGRYLLTTLNTTLLFALEYADQPCTNVELTRLPEDPNKPQPEDHSELELSPIWHVRPNADIYESRRGLCHDAHGVVFSALLKNSLRVLIDGLPAAPDLASRLLSEFSTNSAITGPTLLYGKNSLGYETSGRMVTSLGHDNEEIWRIEANARVNFVRASPNNTSIGFTAGVQCWMVAEDGRVIYRRPTCGSFLLVADDGAGLLSDEKLGFTALWPNGEIRAKLTLPGTHGGYISQDRNIVLWRTVYGRESTLWLIRLDGVLLGRFSINDRLREWAWSRDGTRLTVAGVQNVWGLEVPNEL